MKLVHCMQLIRLDHLMKASALFCNSIMSMPSVIKFWTPLSVHRQNRCPLTFRLKFYLVGPRERQSKKKGMPQSVPSARYSLVKGERIVRSVLSTRLRDFYGGIQRII
jgi:hypothetical protein